MYVMFAVVIALAFAIAGAEADFQDIMRNAIKKEIYTHVIMFKL